MRILIIPSVLVSRSLRDYFTVVDLRWVRSSRSHFIECHATSE
jgi:hypothetical protein